MPVARVLAGTRDLQSLPAPVARTPVAVLPLRFACGTGYGRLWSLFTQSPAVAPAGLCQ
ncbi:hypothetical protein GCM10009414_14660 [Tatumella terrea]